MAWPEVKFILSAMPSLRILELGSNCLGQLEDTNTNTEKEIASELEMLNFDENNLRDWCNVIMSIIGLKRSYDSFL